MVAGVRIRQCVLLHCPSASVKARAGGSQSLPANIHTEAKSVHCSHTGVPEQHGDRDNTRDVKNICCFLPFYVRICSSAATCRGKIV